MGALPAPRVQPSRPFSKVSVDYAEPVSIKMSRGRGARSCKGYIGVFVCLSTKAVHLEAIGDLTTATFLATLRRFSSRRGAPVELWSDSATTFRGADAELRALLRNSEVQWDVVKDTLANEGITWRFIPPSAPHFGGLWEAAVKSAKSHLKRVVGQHRLTYEEMSTLLAQIEFCMNSRPLIPLTGDTDDLDVLTPWHLITGHSPNVLPEPPSEIPALDPLSHWRLVQAMRNHFWHRWARDYLHTLQQRSKWQVPKDNLQVHDLVLLLDPSLLRHGRWPLGRVMELFPGRDNLVRVASVRTATGVYRRPITKLCKILRPAKAP